MGEILEYGVHPVVIHYIYMYVCNQLLSPFSFFYPFLSIDCIYIHTFTIYKSFSHETNRNTFFLYPFFTPLIRFFWSNIVISRDTWMHLINVRKDDFGSKAYLSKDWPENNLNYPVGPIFSIFCIQHDQRLVKGGGDIPSSHNWKNWGKSQERKIPIFAHSPESTRPIRLLPENFCPNAITPEKYN